MRKSDITDLRSVVLDGHPRPVLLLGAGASVTSGVPLVRALVDLIGRHAFCRANRREPDDPTLVRSDWYPWVAAHDWYDDGLELQELYARHIEELLQPRARRRQFLQEHVLVSPENASRGYRALSSLIGKRRIHSVLTPNFDTLVIDSCRRDPSAATVIQVHSPADVDLISTDPPVSQVIHVHGVVDQYADLNLTEEVARLDAEYARRIIPLITDHPLIVIGYRGAEPSVFRDLLMAAAEAGRVPLPHGVYWCYRSRDGDLHPNVLRLADRCGNNFALVEIDGFDEVMTALDEEATRLVSIGAPSRVPFDGRPLDASDIDLDHALVERTLNDDALARLALQPPAGGPESALDRLRLLGLIVSTDDGEEVPTNAARLLFGVGQTIRAEIDVQDERHVLGGNLFHLYDTLTDLLADANEPYRIKGPQSIDVRPYPPMAIKELLINALVHRDYDVDGCIEIAIDRQRLRIANPGGLVDPDDIGDLGEREVRHYRNPSLAEVLYATGLMDKHGSGLVDVARWARDGGGVATFEVGPDNNHFEAVVTSRADSRDASSIGESDGAYEVFYLNAFGVDVPKEIWVAPTRAKRPREIFEAHRGEAIPAFVLDGSNLLTFSDLTDPLNPLVRHVESPERHGTDELSATRVGEAHLIELLNWMFERHMRDDGIEVHHKKSRIWFHIEPDGRDRVIEYRARSRMATRTVARLKNAESKRPYYEHQAIGWSFLRVDGGWLLTVDPTWVFTCDGRGKFETRRRTTQLSTRKMANERNQAVLNHVYFWGWAICGDEDFIYLDEASEAVRIERWPLRRHEAGMEPSVGSGEDDAPDPEDLEQIEDDEVDDYDDLEDDE